MPVESAADRAAFFNTEEYAEAAFYTAPGGAPVACTVIVDRGQGRRTFEAGPMEAAGADRLIQVLAEGAAPDDDPGITPERDGLFNLTDPMTAATETVRVVGEPMLDRTGAWWTVEVVQESA